MLNKRRTRCRKMAQKVIILFSALLLFLERRVKKYMSFGYPSSYGMVDPSTSYRTSYQGHQSMQPQTANNYIMQPQQSQLGNNYMMPPQVQPVEQQSIPQQQPVTNSEIQWVKGIEGAKSYQVQPGTSIILMDSESQTFFIKSANAAGIPEIHAYSFKEIYEINGQVISQAYVPQKEFAQLKSQFDELQAQLELMIKEKQEKPVKKSSLILKGDAE